MSGAAGVTVLFHPINPDYEMEHFQYRIAFFPAPVVYYSSAAAYRLAGVCQPYRMAAVYVFKPATMVG